MLTFENEIKKLGESLEAGIAGEMLSVFPGLMNIECESIEGRVVGPNVIADIFYEEDPLITTAKIVSKAKSIGRYLLESFDKNKKYRYIYKQEFPLGISVKDIGDRCRIILYGNLIEQEEK